MSRRERQGKDFALDARLYAVSSGPYKPSHSPHAPVIILRASGSPGCAAACDQWRSLAEAVLGELGHRAVYVIDFTALAAEVPRERSCGSLGPVLRPVCRVLSRLNPRGATMLALSGVCALALKLVVQGVQQLEGLIEEVVMVSACDPPALHSKEVGPSVHLIQMRSDDGMVQKWEAAGAQVTRSVVSQQGLPREQLVGEIAACIIERTRGRSPPPQGEKLDTRYWEVKFAINPISKQIEQRVKEEGAARPPGIPAADAPPAQPAAPAQPAPPRADPAPVRPAPPSGAAPAQTADAPATPCEWWVEDRDDFFAAESHMWSMRPGASIERLPVRVLKVEPVKREQWWWAEVADLHGSTRVCFRHPAQAKVLREGNAATLTGRVLTDASGCMYVCVPPDEPDACANLEDVPVTVPEDARAVERRPGLAQRCGLLLLRGSKVVLTRVPRDGGCRASLVFPSAIPQDEETPEATAVRALCDALDVDPDEFVLAPHLGTVSYFPRRGVVEHLYFGFAIRPPPGGAARDAQEWPLEPCTSYDWFTLQHALRTLGPGRREEQDALWEAARRLRVAVDAGVIKHQWGCGVFGVADARAVGDGVALPQPAAAAVGPVDPVSAIESMPLAEGLQCVAEALALLSKRAQEQGSSAGCAGAPSSSPALAAAAPAACCQGECSATATPPAATDGLLPTTVLSGWLGAGKTTLLQHILENRQGLRVAVVVNDMTDVNVDATLVEQGGADLSPTEDKLVELSNGCIARRDMLEEVARLAQEGRFDHLVIESTGISEPRPLAETFALDTAEGTSLANLAKLDTMVTVVDCPTFLREVTPEFAAMLKSGGGDEQTIGHLLVGQVRFADVILLNKSDLVTADELKKVRSLVSELNGSAKILETVRSSVDVKEVVGTGRFSMSAAKAHPGWMGPERTPETPYGISSFVYRRRKPFHPGRLDELLRSSEGLSAVVRSKGYVWIATRPDQLGRWSQAGRSVAIEGGQPWWAAVAEAEWPAGLREELKRTALWQEPHGDRQQELVVTGVHLDRGKIEAALDRCLLTDEEMRSDWAALDDPLPQWEGSDSGEDHSHDAAAG